MPIPRNKTAHYLERFSLKNKSRVNRFNKLRIRGTEQVKNRFWMCPPGWGSVGGGGVETVLNHNGRGGPGSVAHTQPL